MLVDPAAFALTKLALESGSLIDLSKFDKAYCLYLSTAALIPDLCEC
jgi:hypothetical protein